LKRRGTEVTIIIKGITKITNIKVGITHLMGITETVETVLGIDPTMESINIVKTGTVQKINHMIAIKTTGQDQEIDLGIIRRTSIEMIQGINLDTVPRISRIIPVIDHTLMTVTLLAKGSHTIKKIGRVGLIAGTLIEKENRTGPEEISIGEMKVTKSRLS
jgi:hypothetical protein